MSGHPNLSHLLRSTVRQRIVDGALPPGSRINEVHLAEELGVSRTPLREALVSLVAEGALERLPRRGFFVRPLTAEELRAIYPIRALLDPEALRLAGLPSAGRLRRLHDLNRRLDAAPGVAERIRLDDAWHLELVADCPNPVLLELIGQFILRTRRYELALYRERRAVEVSTADHDRVLAACEAGDLAAAVDALRANLTHPLEPLLAWLEERSPDREEIPR